MRRWKKKRLLFLLIGMMTLSQNGICAEELTDGIVGDYIDEQLLYGNIVEEINVPSGIEDSIVEALSEEEIYSDSKKEYDEELCDELEEVNANNLIATITGCYNSSNGGDIRWTRVNGATGYVLYRMRSADGLKKIATINNPDVLQYIDKAIKDNCWGRVYTYYIRPIINGKEGLISNVATLQRLAPMKFTSSTSSKAGTVSLKWSCTVSSNKALGYEIQYAMSTSDLYNQKGSFKKVTLSGRNSLSKTLTGLTAGKTYYFRNRCFVNYTHSLTGKTTKTWSQYSTVAKVGVSQGITPVATKDVTIAKGKTVSEAAALLGLKLVPDYGDYKNYCYYYDKYVRVRERYYTATGTFSKNCSYIKSDTYNMNYGGRWDVCIKDNTLSLYGITVGAASSSARNTIIAKGWKEWVGYYLGGNHDWTGDHISPLITVHNSNNKVTDIYLHWQYANEYES